MIDETIERNRIKIKIAHSEWSCRAKIRRELLLTQRFACSTLRWRAILSVDSFIDFPTTHNVDYAFIERALFQDRSIKCNDAVNDDHQSNCPILGSMGGSVVSWSVTLLPTCEPCPVMPFVFSRALVTMTLIYNRFFTTRRVAPWERQTIELKGKYIRKI